MGGSFVPHVLGTARVTECCSSSSIYLNTVSLKHSLLAAFPPNHRTNPYLRNTTGNLASPRKLICGVEAWPSRASRSTRFRNTPRMQESKVYVCAA